MPPTPTQPKKASLIVYVLATVVVWALIFVIGYFLSGPTLGYPVLHVFAGFYIGMLAMYIAVHIYRWR